PAQRPGHLAARERPGPDAAAAGHPAPARGYAMKRRLLPFAGAVLFAAASVVPLRAWLERDRFDHLQHANLFPTCESCHVGVATAESAEEPSIWPPAEVCAACHDGSIEAR